MFPLFLGTCLCSLHPSPDDQHKDQHKEVLTPGWGSKRCTELAPWQIEPKTNACVSPGVEFEPHPLAQVCSPHAPLKPWKASVSSTAIPPLPRGRQQVALEAVDVLSRLVGCERRGWLNFASTRVHGSLAGGGDEAEAQGKGREPDVDVASVQKPPPEFLPWASAPSSPRPPPPRPHRAHPEPLCLEPTVLSKETNLQVNQGSQR